MFLATRRSWRQPLRVAILIPAYNAEKTIAEVVQQVSSFASREDIVVIDDGSLDGTASKLPPLGITALYHRENRGKGAALRTGFHHLVSTGRYDGIIILDSDGQHDPRFIPSFIERASRGDVDILVGTRMGRVGEMPLIRRLTNRLTSAIISALAKQKIPDSQSGYRLIRCRVLRSLRLRTTRYDTESEMLIQAGRLGFRIGSVPISSIYGDEVSAIRPARDTVRFIRLVLRMAFNL
jgi:glycosyltransferase involved in cell wall biosynthesis